MYSRPTIYAVAFDGTLHDGRYPNIGVPNFSLIEKIIGYKKRGCSVILWTCRDGKELEDAVRFCKSYGIELDAVNDNTDYVKKQYGCNPRKVIADVYIDSKSYRPKVSDGTKEVKQKEVKHSPASCVVF